jgi:hypothetical protein
MRQNPELENSSSSESRMHDTSSDVFSQQVTDCWNQPMPSLKLQDTASQHLPSLDLDYSHFGRTLYNDTELGLQILRDNFQRANSGSPDSVLSREDIQSFIHQNELGEFGSKAVQRVLDNYENIKNFSNDRRGEEHGLTPQDLDAGISREQAKGARHDYAPPNIPPGHPDYHPTEPGATAPPEQPNPAEELPFSRKQFAAQTVVDNFASIDADHNGFAGKGEIEAWVDNNLQTPLERKAVRRMLENFDSVTNQVNDQRGEEHGASLNDLNSVIAKIDANAERSGYEA